ncbi:sugar ABC transporter permease [Okibacterium endophyticum]
MLPFLVFALVFLVYPLFEVIRMSVSDIALSGSGFVFRFNGFDNIASMLADPMGWRAILNTVVFVAITVVGSLILGVALAILVVRAVRLLPLARNVLVWPAVIAPVVVSLVWLLILSPTAGGLNKLLALSGLPSQEWLNTGAGAMLAVAVVDIWHWTPVVFLFAYTALQGIDASILEAARVDGASERKTLRLIILPLLWPTIIGVALVRTIMGIKAFDEMYLMTRGGPGGATTLVSQQIKVLFFDDREFGQASAYSLLVVVLTALVLGAILFARTRKGATL